MKANKVLPLFSSIFVLSLVSCGGVKEWNEAGTSLTVNYCLLQGQLDHNDSIERTRGVRDKLGTRANNDDTLNENTQAPKVNTDFEVEDKDGNKFKTTIREIEHATMISTAGATWDSITANDTSTIWLNKHSADRWTDLEGNSKEGQSITMFISNNDGMSMGALGSVMWPKGMPIFGFDANENAIAAVLSGQMTGTIDCNSAAQVASCVLMIRNITDCEDESKKFTDEVAFANIAEGFYPEGERPYGYIRSGHVVYQEPLTEGGKAPRAMLSQGSPITKNKEDGGKGERSSYEKLLDFFDENGNIKSAVDRAPTDEPGLRDSPSSGLPKRRVFMTYNNQTDTYFSATIKPLFNHYSRIYNLDITDFSGSGSDETTCLDAFAAAVNTSGYDAFIINMVKSSNGAQYLEKLKASQYFDKTTKKITVPVIFWNKQPTDVDGNVDVDFMYDDAFSFVAYSGIDSRASGQTQGEMIRDWVINQYKGNKY